MQEVPLFRLPNVIGVYSPRPQSGKSTVAAYLRDHVAAPMGITLVTIKIADPIKQPLYALGLTEEEVEGKLKDVPHTKLDGRTPREEMIRLAREGAEKLGADWLARRAESRIAEAVAQGKVVIVDDIRRPSEYDLIRQFAGNEMWRLFRPKEGEAVVTDSANYEGLLEDHVFDLRLQNTGTLAFLYAQLASHLRVPRLDASC
ncbi:MAG: hypothetical protein GC134_05640 [Proteobacteria bacterium]|nr:hypothetical protein [Pseudomonadota bacterium]